MTTCGLDHFGPPDDEGPEGNEIIAQPSPDQEGEDDGEKDEDQRLVVEHGQVLARLPPIGSRKSRRVPCPVGPCPDPRHSL